MKKYLIALSSIYWISYLIKSFIIWEFVNPFKWLLDIPKEDENYRSMVLVSVVMYVGFISLFTWIFAKHKEDVHNKTV